MMTTEDRFTHLAERWFLTEPAFFAMYCSHTLVINPNMNVPIRTGQGRIEYNPELLRGHGEDAFEELVRIEMIRLFLKHPYERFPSGCPRHKMKKASDMTLTSHYKFRFCKLIKPSDMQLPPKMHYEWYLQNMPDSVEGGSSPEKRETDFPECDSSTEKSETGPSEGGSSTEKRETDSSGGGSATDVSEANIPGGGSATEMRELVELWQEDEWYAEKINGIIESVKDWGSLIGDFSETIIANTKARIDYRKVLSGFRASVLSTKRRLTRMKPNRRCGFEQMGSSYDFTTKLLIAVDTSGSISTEMLKHFFSVITKFFKYGIERLDVIQFDCDLKGEPISISRYKVPDTFEVTGRGGTYFQPVFDYVQNHVYDGLIILTDGYALVPSVGNCKSKVLWVCESEQSFEQHKDWMRTIGRVCYLNLKQ